MHLTRVSLTLLVLVAGLGLASCTSSPTADWPELGSESEVVDIDPNLIQAAGSAENPTQVDPFFSPETPWRFYDSVDFADLENGTLREGVASHRYPHLTVAGHYRATGTYVFHLVEEDLFYLWGDDMAGHFDGMVGPFQGDPRNALPQAVRTP